jgi:hypothetical protein
LVLHTTYVVRVPYSCGVVFVFLFWQEIGVGVTYILSVHVLGHQANLKELLKSKELAT